MNEFNREVTVEEIVQAVNKVINTMTAPAGTPAERGSLVQLGPVKASEDVKEVGVAIGPAYGLHIHHTINGLDHMVVLKEILAGIEEEGMIPRVIRGTRTSDVAFIANDVAKLVGSGIAIGIQSKGTTVIHQKDLYPLTNLELFPQAPIITLEMYRQIGKNAAKYAKGDQVKPIRVVNDISSRPKYQVKAALMHTKETEYVVKRGPYMEIELPV
jgi:glycerol dehydratase medium subunit/propanediol dehydratase medium subunit